MQAKKYTPSKESACVTYMAGHALIICLQALEELKGGWGWDGNGREGTTTQDLTESHVQNPPTTQWCQAAAATAGMLKVLSNKHQLQVWTLDHTSHMCCVLSCSFHLFCSNWNFTRKHKVPYRILTPQERAKSMREQQSHLVALS